MVALVLMTMFDGAFDIRHWGLLGAFSAVALAVAAWRRPVRPLLVALVAIWGLAAWSLFSILWADLPGPALEGGARTALYALLLTLPALTLGAREARVLAAAVVAGLALIVAITAARLLVDDLDVLLAGRLNEPVGYRNGSACLFVAAFWALTCFAAYRPALPALRVPAFGLAVAALGLAFVTQSRGAVLALVGGGLLCVGFGPDRLRRAWLTLFAVGAVAALSQAMLAPYDAYRDHTDIESAMRDAGVAVLAVALAGAAVLAALVAGERRVTARSAVTIRRTASLGIAALVIVGALGAVVAVRDPFDVVETRWREFKTLESTAGPGTRLASGGGPRYDLWRIALDEFADEPLRGVGEGNYRVTYFRERRNDNNIISPHSLPLRVLSELGLVGGLLLAALFGGLLFAARARWRHASHEARLWATGIGAAGTAVLTQASVDWFWLIPGLVGLALACIGIALALLGGSSPVARAGRRVPRVAGRVVLVVLALGLGALFLSDLHVRRARAEDLTAQERLDEARTAEKLNPLDVTPLYLQAGALEELGRRDDARAELRDAADREPENFVNHLLLGDLELRAGNDRAARRHYRRASELNPRDVGLRALAQQRDP